MPAAVLKLDRSFQALANGTRRAVVQRLLRGPATVSELAEPFDMALPSFLEHLRTLERSGLVRSAKAGRVRTVRIVPARLAHAATWLDRQRTIWEQRLDQLDAYVNKME
jgi:DNA-binding transcriptional ArsR family regulator